MPCTRGKRSSGRESVPRPPDQSRLICKNLHSPLLLLLRNTIRSKRISLFLQFEILFDSKMVKGRVSKVLSWRFFMLLSFTVNVGFLGSILHERVSLNSLSSAREDQTVVCSVNDHQAHISKSCPASTSITEAEDGSKKVIDLQHGDPTMFERFWQKMGDKSTVVISGWQLMSYFSDIKNLCWFMEPGFAKEVIRLHKLVRNAMTEDRHVVVGTGSIQLLQAALYALSPPHASNPIGVVAAAPYYSSYPAVTDYLKSGLYNWAGDAYSFDRDEPYIELVTSPNNPDGYIREAVVNRSGGMVIHDLAYYWPHYTPITSPADHDLMLFTVSKSTGHAGTRIGWALVKDKEVAKKMAKFIELNTLGVSKDSQLRAAKILQAISDNCQHLGNNDDGKSFFRYSHRLITERWEGLRDAVRQSGLFSLPEFQPRFCNYLGKVAEPHPAFAWLKCVGDIEDCESFLKGHQIITRSGKHFGVDSTYVRVNMLDRDETFYLFLERLSHIY